MVLTIGNDFQSMPIGVALGNHNKKLLLYTQRMASGLKINKASDDAANLSLSTQITKSINTTETLEDNAKTGINLLNTADGDLSEISVMLQRMRDLSVQGLNGVYSADEKAIIMNEINRLGEEVKRVTQSSSFGDKKIFAKDPDNPLSVLASASGDSGGIEDSDYINLDSISNDMLFADVLAKDSDVYMLNMTAGQSSYVEFNNKLYLITNNSTTTKNLVYGYEENLGDENQSIKFVQDFDGVSASFVSGYQNTQTQMGSGQSYLNVPGGQTNYVTMGTNVYSLTNASATDQTAVFTTGGIISGQDVTSAYQVTLSPYNTAVGNEIAMSLNGSQSKNINAGGSIYRITNNSATPETFIYRPSPATPLSGNTTNSLIGSVTTPTDLNTNYYNQTLTPSQELYYQYAGNYYSIRNNTAQTQTLIVNATNNTILNPNVSTTRTNINPIADTTISSMGNPFVMDVIAGQKYYLEDTDGHSTVYELTTAATGKLIVNYDSSSVNSVGGVGATVTPYYDTPGGGYERHTPTAGSGYKFTVNFANNEEKVININPFGGQELYKVTNTGGAKAGVVFTWNSATHTITQDVPDPEITNASYEGTFDTGTWLNQATDYYLSTLNNGQSNYMKCGADIFKVTNSSGSATDAIMSYNPAIHTLSTTTGGVATTRIDYANFIQDNAVQDTAGFTAGQTRIFQYGTDIFSVRNTTANPQNLIFTYNAGALTVNDPLVAANFTITPSTIDLGTNLNAGDIYTTLNAGQTKYVSSGGMYFSINNPSGARTVAFRQSGADLTQLGGAGVTDTYLANESYETLSTTNDYYIEMAAGTTQYIKVGSNSYRLTNTSGSTKTDVFRQVGNNLVSQNPQITETYIPISNQNNFAQVLPVIDWAMDVVNNKRAVIGSKIVSMQQTIETNQSRRINLTNANSVILDADIAKERSDYLKTEILSNFTARLFMQSKEMNRDIVLNLLKP